MAATYDDYRDRHVVVTGAGRGIGRVIAQAFAGQGARVSALDIDFFGYEAAPGVRQVRCDVTDEAAIEAACTEIVNRDGPPVALVNNAGVDRRMPLEDISAEVFSWMMAVNLNHHAAFARLLVPGMAAAGGGAIVGLTSTAWMKRSMGMVAYHAAKAGIVGLTHGLARDLGPQGIRVNAIAPGRVPTPERTPDVDDPAFIASTHAMQCIPALMEPQDIAEAALWLASSSARMVTGQVLVVDGGGVGIPLPPNQMPLKQKEDA
ncbi:SDR family NAD(P)-dependent oxidoreductase [Halovulum sp. GXIMD14794]